MSSANIECAIVPVAGLGTRLLPSTKSQPKEMLPVGRKPVVQYVVEELEAAGLKRILFITGRGKKAIEDHFDRDPELNRLLQQGHKAGLLAELTFEETSVAFYYIRQGEQLGLGHAVLQAEAFPGDQPFVVALGDSIISNGSGGTNIVRKLIDCCEEKDASCVIAFEEVPLEDTPKYGIAKPATDGDIFRVESLIEKPSVSEAPSNLAIAGRYVLSPRVFEALRETPPGKNNEIQLTDAVRILMRRGEAVYGVRLAADEKRHDIGNFGSYFRSFLEFALRDSEHGPPLRRHLRTLLHEGEEDNNNAS